MEALYTSPYFGVALSVIAFGAGVRIQQKTKSALCNPLIIAIVLIIGVLLVFKIPYDSYNKGGEIINMFLAPATACLAVSILYEAFHLEKILASYYSRMYSRFSGVHGQRVRNVQTVQTGSEPDHVHASQIRYHTDRCERCAGTRRRRTRNGRGGNFHRDIREHCRAAAYTDF